MRAKKIVLSGGPSSGKTTLINELERLGKYCFHEVSRELIREAQKKGIEQPFLTHPKQFNEEILNSRILQYTNAEKISQDFCFFDRGLIDVIAYIDYAKQPIPKSFSSACKTYLYDTVFLLPPWDEIHTQDTERYETFEQAKIIYECLKKNYIAYGYHIIEVPTGKVSDRVSFILKHCL